VTDRQTTTTTKSRPLSLHLVDRPKNAPKRFILAQKLKKISGEEAETRGEGSLFHTPLRPNAGSPRSSLLFDGKLHFVTPTGSRGQFVPTNIMVHSVGFK